MQLSSAFRRAMSGRRVSKSSRALLCAAIAAAPFVQYNIATAAPTGIFSSATFTPANQMTDTNVGLNAAKTYQLNGNIGGSALTINGVSFSAAGATTGGTSPNTWALTGAATSFTGNATNLTGGLAALAAEFTYGGNPATLTLNGLTSGQVYSLSFYNVGFGSVGGRVMSSIVASDGGSIAGFDANASGNGNGNLLRYTFVANAATESLVFTPQSPGDTYHFYGFSNEQVFNNTFSSASGSNWSTATYSVPTFAPTSGLAGTNVIFPQLASAGTVNLDSNQTVGHIRFASTNNWTIASAGAALTLQADTGAISVLNSVSGANTIAAPVTFASSVAKYGTGGLIFTNAVTTNGNLLTIANDGGVQFGDGASVGSIDGPILNNGTLTFATPAGSQSYGSPTATISGPGNLVAAGPGTLSLDGPNTFTGTTTTTGTGTILVNHTSALAGSTFTPSTSIQFAAGIGAFTIGNLNGSTDLVLSDTGSADIALSVGANNLNAAYAGNLSDGSGAGSLTKVGTGLQLLSGSNTYGGNTLVSAGTLELGQPSSLANFGAPGRTSVSAGATLAAQVGASPNSFTSGNLDTLRSSVNFAANATLGIDTTNAVAGTFTYSSGITNTTGGGNNLLNVTKFGTGTLVLGGTNTYTGTTSVQNGTLQVAGSASITGNGTLSLGSGTNSGLFVLGDGAGPATATFSAFAVSGTGTTNAIVGGNAAVSTLTVNNTASTTLAAKIGGTGANQNNIALTKTGAGTLSVTAANTYTGLTSINAGVLSFANGSLGSGTITFGGGTLQYATGNAQDVSARIKNSTSAVAINTNGGGAYVGSSIDGTNTAGLTKSGTGVLTVGVQQGYAGDTVISGGTLRLGGVGVAVGSGAYATSTNYTFAPAANNQLATLSPISNTNGSGGAEGSGAVTKLTDGAVNTATSVNPNVYTVGNGAVITFQLPTGTSPSGFNLTGANLYSLWNDLGRDNINLNSIGYSTVANPTVFTTIPGSGVGYAPTARMGLATLSSSTGLLATGVSRVQFNFANQENGYVGFAELEVIATATPTTSLLPVTTNVKIGSGATFDLGGVSQTIASLGSVANIGGSVVNSGLAPVTLTSNPGTGVTASFGGVISDPGAATAISFTKSGLGTQTLGGNNTYSGSTSITGGTLKLAPVVSNAATYTTATTYTFNGAANLLSGQSPTSVTNGRAGVEGSGGVGVLTDGLIGALTGANNVARYTIGDNSVLTYSLGTAASGYTLSGVTLYTIWNDAGRSDITISNISYSLVTNPTVFQAIPGTALNFTNTVNGTSIASLSDAGGFLASGVANIRFNFGVQENGHVGYGELQVFGTPTTILPVTTNVNIAAGSTLDLGGFSQTIASLADGVGGGGSVINSATVPVQLTINPASGSTTFTGTITDGGTNAISVTKTGAGTQVLAGTNTYSGTTTVSGGKLVVTGSLPSAGSVVVGSGATLSGSGSVGSIAAASPSSAGVVAPANVTQSILTARTITGGGTTGLQFAFQLTKSSGQSPDYGTATAAGNDVLRLTGPTAVTSPLTSANSVSVYLPAGLTGTGETFKGGFYADSDTGLLSEVQSATYTFYEAAPGSVAPSAVVYNGVTYQPLSDFGFVANVSVVSDTANFGAGPVTGQITQFTVVPEPTAAALMGIGALGLLARRRRAAK